MELSDEQLVRRIIGGDSTVFSALVERYKIQIFNLMYRYCGSVEEATDMSQDVFCRVYEKLDSYREHSSFFAWLYTIALNHARDWQRKRRSHESKIGMYGYTADFDNSAPDMDLETKQEIEELTQALHTLPEDRREMLWLRYRHDRTIKELAEIFELSESAVKMRLQRALAELHKILGGSQHEKT